MNGKYLSSKLPKYLIHLKGEERSENTLLKYNRDLRKFMLFLQNRELNKALLLEWKEQLTSRYSPASVNSMLAALNSFFDWMELPEYRVKPLKIQREIFTRPERELSRNEYKRLVLAAQRKDNSRLSLLLQTICATGIRVSELQFVTVGALHSGRATVDCKGKTRTVLLPRELCRALKGYCRDKGILKGSVFCTAGGKALNRTNIWRDMKLLCKSAGVEQSKVFPHNLRHLFARSYYSVEKDISRLADLLGHSSVNTTRIYTMESGKEHIRQIERLGLVLN